MDLKRIKNKISVPVHSEDNNNKNKPTSNSTNSNMKINYIVVPCTTCLSESIKRYDGRNMAYKYTLKGGKTIKDILVAPRDKDYITKKSSESYTDTKVTGWNVMKNT